MNARRHHPAGVLPLELWDALVGERPLYLLRATEIGPAIAQVVRELSVGKARRLRAHEHLPKLAFERVVLAGGGPIDEAAAALQALGFPTSRAQDPHWIAERGGRALLATLCAPERGAVLDVGQTALKYSDARGRSRWERSLCEVPLELDARDPALHPGYRANTIAFFAAPLLRAPALAGLVLALPCEIADDLSVAGCSYPWLAGDRTLIGDLLRFARLSHVPCLVLNDAELAAVSVAQEGRRRRRYAGPHARPRAGCGATDRNLSPSQPEPAQTGDLAFHPDAESLHFRPLWTRAADQIVRHARGQDGDARKEPYQATLLELIRGQ